MLLIDDKSDSLPQLDHITRYELDKKWLKLKNDKFDIYHKERSLANI